VKTSVKVQILYIEIATAWGLPEVPLISLDASAVSEDHRVAAHAVEPSLTDIELTPEPKFWPLHNKVRAPLAAPLPEPVDTEAASKEWTPLAVLACWPAVRTMRILDPVPGDIIHTMCVWVCQYVVCAAVGPIRVLTVYARDSPSGIISRYTARERDGLFVRPIILFIREMSYENNSEALPIFDPVVTTNLNDLKIPPAGLQATDDMEAHAVESDDE